MESEKGEETSQYTCFHLGTSGKINSGVTRGKKQNRQKERNFCSSSIQMRWCRGGDMALMAWELSRERRIFRRVTAPSRLQMKRGSSCNSHELCRLEINELTLFEGFSLCQHKAVGETKPVLEHQKQHIKCGNYNRHCIRCQIMQGMNQTSIWQLWCIHSKLPLIWLQREKNNLQNNFQCEPCFRKGHCSIFQCRTTSLVVEPPSLQKC